MSTQPLYLFLLMAVMPLMNYACSNGQRLQLMQPENPSYCQVLATIIHKTTNRTTPTYFLVPPIVYIPVQDKKTFLEKLQHFEKIPNQNSEKGLLLIKNAKK
jgi:hypothetical protein